MYTIHFMSSELMYLIMFLKIKDILMKNVIWCCANFYSLHEVIELRALVFKYTSVRQLQSATNKKRPFHWTFHQIMMLWSLVLIIQFSKTPWKGQLVETRWRFCKPAPLGYKQAIAYEIQNFTLKYTTLQQKSHS